MMEGRRLGADEARSLGLVDEVVAPEAVLDWALDRAAALAAGATLAQGLAKRAIASVIKARPKVSKIDEV